MNADRAPVPNSTVLLVDDNARYRTMLLKFTRSMGFTSLEAADGAGALEQLESHPEIDIVLSDLRMPVMDGATLLGHITARWPDKAVIMISGGGDLELAVKCLSMGAMDYIGKPFQFDELRTRITQVLDRRRLLLETARLRQENRAYQRQLESHVMVQGERIESLFLASITSLAGALEAKDPYTHGHSVRVSHYSVLLARQLGCSEELIRDVALGGNIHDVGKIGVPESLLHKPSRLTDQEYAEIMRHPLVGARILEPLMLENPVALHIVRSHHERPDGRGLPDGLSGDAIPFEARITAVADSFDAMTSDRPYRIAGLPWETAVDEIRRGSGTQFDPDVVAAFLACVAAGTISPQLRAEMNDQTPQVRWPEARRGTYHPHATLGPVLVRNSEPAVPSFAALLMSGLQSMGERTGFDLLILGVHRPDANVIEQAFTCTAGRDGAAFAVRREPALGRFGVQWTDSLTRACVHRGLYFTDHLHDAFTGPTAIHAAGYETFMCLACGAAGDASLYLIGASRESLYVSANNRRALETLAAAIADHARLHTAETCAAVLAERTKPGAGVTARGRLGRRRTIAVITDDIALRTLAQTALAGTHRVLVFDESARSLDDFRNVWPDLVLLDVELGAGDGYNILRVIRDDDALYDLGVIAAFSGDGRPIDYTRVGFDGAIHKGSASPALLADTVGMCLEDYSRVHRSRRALRTVPREVMALEGEPDEHRSARARVHLSAIARLAVRNEPTDFQHAPASSFVALEFDAARRYASNLRQDGVSRREALAAFRDLFREPPPAHPAKAKTLERIEAACLELFDSALTA